MKAKVVKVKASDKPDVELYGIEITNNGKRTFASAGGHLILNTDKKTIEKIVRKFNKNPKSLMKRKENE